MKFRFLLFYFITTHFALAEVPQNVEGTWADFDPRADQLEVEIVREKIGNGIVLNYIRYVVGTFGGKKTKVAAFYARPEDGEALPAVVQIHGGGQFAREGTVLYWASRGYAAVAVNWGEKVIDRKDDPNTDWQGIPAGFLDPTHHNDVTPGGGTIHSVPHPWNSSWLLYSAAARRAITFLEHQPEVDSGKIGVLGHSMGGRLTVLTSIDPRIKAASPSVGGSGFLYDDIAGVPGSARRMKQDLELYKKTLDCSEYWPLIRCPVMFLGATNDFNSPMELVIQGFQRLPKDNGSLSFTPHMNHRFTADNYAARVRWFDAHLKGKFDYPAMPETILELTTETGVPLFTVRPDPESPYEIENVRIYYGYDRDPRARFWRSAEVVKHGKTWQAECPVMEIAEPLFVFANVVYETGKEIAMPQGYSPTSLLTVTGIPHAVCPRELQQAGVKSKGTRQRLIDDFANGWQDWSLVGVAHRAHWNFETHKVADPAYFGPRGARLAFEIETTHPGDTLAVILETDKWRSYTGRKTRRYVAFVDLGEEGRKSISLPVSDFTTEHGDPLENYDFVTSLIFTPAQKERPGKYEKEWQGNVPVFANLRWEGGEFANRPRPYLATGASEIDADAAFREQFREAVDTSVEREKQDRQ